MLVEEHLRRFEHEEAAEDIAQRAPGNLDEHLARVFDPTRLPVPLRKGAVRHLPRIAKSFVMTTNFDAILETAFREVGKESEFKGVFAGSRKFMSSEL
jgi:hypothetical protein